MIANEVVTSQVGVVCLATPEYLVYILMETKLVFARMLNKDLVGQYSGPDQLYLLGSDASDYRTVAFAVLNTISTDSLNVMDGQHLSNPVLSISISFGQPFKAGILDMHPTSAVLTYTNGTKSVWPDEAGVYNTSIYNLMNVAAHTVDLELGCAGPENIYLNHTVLNETISPNRAPLGTAPANWAEGYPSFIYGNVTPPYQTWAEMLLAGQTITLGNATGLPSDTKMVTSYLCPSYKLKPIRSLLTSVFVGTATMVLSLWAAWMFVTTFIAKRIQKPRELTFYFETATAKWIS